MSQQLIISAVGPDRPGIVGELTAYLHSAGGNILDSRMVNLRGQFALVVLFEVPDEAARMLQRDLPGAGTKMGLNLFVNSQTAPAKTIDGLHYKLKTYSMDQPGIIARLTNVLRQHGVNIEELVAHQESAAFAGSPLFVTQIKLTVPTGVAVRQLRADLEPLCTELNCDVDLEPAEQPFLGGVHPIADLFRAIEKSSPQRYRLNVIMYAQEKHAVDAQGNDMTHDHIRPAEVIPWVLVIAFGAALVGLCAASAVLFIR